MQTRTGQAAVYVGANQPMAIRRYPVADPGRGEVLLALEASGICGTDVHIIKGRLGIPGPLILGHEFVGRVDCWGGAGALRDGLGRRLRAGDLAVACVAIPCGACFSCARGETASCLNFGVTYVKNPDLAPHFFGGYGEYLYSPPANLVKVPDGVSVKAAASFPCAGPTIIRACAYGGGLEPGELVVVQGAGPVGLFATAWAAAAGCTVAVIGSGHSPARLKLARAFGAKLILDYRALSAEARLAAIRKLALKLNRGDGADVVIEASGAPSAVPEGLDLLRTRGRYLIPGQYSASGAVSVQPEKITFRALRLIGSGQYTLADVGTYLAFLKKQPALQRKFARCLTHSFQVSEANEALATVEAGRAGKAVFTRK